MKYILLMFILYISVLFVINVWVFSFCGRVIKLFIILLVNLYFIYKLIGMSNF